MAKNLVYYKRLLIDTNESPALSDGAGDSLSNDLVLSDDVQNLVLEISAEQYGKLLSASFNGAYTTYPDDYIAVVYPLIKAGKILLCSAILDCIESTPDIQNAIARYSLSPGLTGTTGQDAGLLATNMITDTTGCDNDMIFGAITGLVDLFNNLATDLIEVFVAAPNGVGRLGDIIEAIPGVGVLPFDDLLQFSESFVEDLSENYAAAYTESLRNELRCELFCITQENCQITFEEVFQYFVSRLGVTIDYTNLNALVEDVLGQNWIGTALVDVTHVLFAGILSYGGSLLDIDLASITTLVSSLFNDPDPDWLTLCPSCTATWSKTFDFTTTEYATYKSNINPTYPATWLTAVGYNGGQDSNGDRDGLKITLPTTRTITRRIWSTAITPPSLRVMSG